MDIVVRSGGLRDAPKPEYRDKSILVDVTHADPQAQVRLRAGSVDHDGSVASTSEARKRQHYARPGHVSRRVSRFKLQLRDRQEARRSQRGRDDKPTRMACGWSMGAE